MLATKTLDRLLTTLNVRLHAFSVCEIANGARLLFEPMDGAIVHYVLAGEGVFQVGSAAPVKVAAGAIIVVPQASARP